MLFVVSPGVMQSAAAQTGAGYDELLALFADWREFESPPMLDGAPDYTAAGFAARYESFLVLRNRLHRIDSGDWPVSRQVDWHIVRAEMNDAHVRWLVLVGASPHLCGSQDLAAVSRIANRARECHVVT